MFLPKAFVLFQQRIFTFVKSNFFYKKTNNNSVYIYNFLTLIHHIKPLLRKIPTYWKLKRPLILGMPLWPYSHLSPPEFPPPPTQTLNWCELASVHSATCEKKTACTLLFLLWWLLLSLPFPKFHPPELTYLLDLPIILAFQLPWLFWVHWSSS